MALHRDEVAPSGVHQIDFYSTTDPDSDPDNNVAAGKYWLKTDNLSTPTWFEYYRRNQADSAWVLMWAWGDKPDDWATGDVLYVDANGRLKKLAIGSAGEVLTVNTGLPAWDPPSAGALDDLSDVDAAAPNDGDVLTFDTGSGNWEAAPAAGGGSLEEPPPGGAADMEFNSTTIGGSALGTPTTIDADTTVPGALYVKKAAGGTTFAMHGRYWTLAELGLSLPVTIDAELRGTLMSGQFHRTCLFVSEATPGATVGLYVEWGTAGPAVSVISTTSPTAGAAYVTQNRFTGMVAQFPLLLRIVANSSDDVDMYVRAPHSVVWQPVYLDYNPSWTIGAVGVSTNPENITPDAECVWSYLRFS